MRANVTTCENRTCLYQCIAWSRQIVVVACRHQLVMPLLWRHSVDEAAGPRSPVAAADKSTTHDACCWLSRRRSTAATCWHLRRGGGISSAAALSLLAHLLASITVDQQLSAAVPASRWSIPRYSVRCNWCWGWQRYITSSNSTSQWHNHSLVFSRLGPKPIKPDLVIFDTRLCWFRHGSDLVKNKQWIQVYCTSVHQVQSGQQITV